MFLNKVRVFKTRRREILFEFTKKFHIHCNTVSREFVSRICHKELSQTVVELQFVRGTT